MIPRSLSPQARRNFETWFQENRIDLELHFKQYILGRLKELNAKSTLNETDSGRAKKYQDFLKDFPKDSKVKATWITRRHGQKLRSFLMADSTMCAWCEREINDGGGLFTLDHFFPKSDFPEQALDIENLLPCCSQCNTQKGSHVNQDHKEIINPYKDTPNEYLSMDLNDLKLSGIKSLGKRTIEKLGKVLNTNYELNDDLEEVKGALHTRLKYVEDLMNELDGSEFKPPTILKAYLKGLLQQINRREISATRATVLCHGPAFQKLVEALRAKDPVAAREIDGLIEEKRRYSLYHPPDASSAEVS